MTPVPVLVVAPGFSLTELFRTGRKLDRTIRIRVDPRLLPGETQHTREILGWLLAEPEK